MMRTRGATHLLLLTTLALLAGCGGGGGGSGSGGCSGECQAATPNALTVGDVQQVIARAVFEAQARNLKATIAVVDRVGNVLGVFRMNGAAPTFTISSGTGATGGLEGVGGLPSELAAIAKAVTGAYLSSEGNAFSTRTASQIIQQNFNPGESNQPSGPLFGVQFSQLSCSDLNVQASAGTIGPKRSPLGLAADPGGLPLYKNGTVVGGVGVISDGLYSLDTDIQGQDTDGDELIAVAGGSEFAAPAIAAPTRSPSTAARCATSIPNRWPAIPRWRRRLPRSTGSPARWSMSRATEGAPSWPASRSARPRRAIAPIHRPRSPASAPMCWSTRPTSIATRRFPASDGLLQAGEVTQLLKSALDVANRARAQIRRPLGSAAQVTVTVVDTRGTVLGLVRTPDAPVFGTDVALQKARTAAFFASLTAAAQLNALPPANYPTAPSAYVTALRTFLDDPAALANGIAYSARAIGNIARPFFPDGIGGTGNGPFSLPFPQWSIFNDGLQLDLVQNKVVAAIGGDTSTGCTGVGALANGIQIFPGGVAIYRGNVLVGAIGVSGDGIDQDDMVAFLGLANGASIVGNGLANAPPAIRSDTIVPQGEGTRLRYVNCPQAPFNGSSQQNAVRGHLIIGWDARGRARGAIAALAGCGTAHAQPKAPAQAVMPPCRARAAAACPPDGHYGLQVLVGDARRLRGAPSRRRVIAQLQEGAQVEALERRDAWYRIALSDGRAGWVDQVRWQDRAPTFPSKSRRRGCARSPMMRNLRARADPHRLRLRRIRMLAAGESAQSQIAQRQPMGKPFEALIPAIDPKQVPPPQALLPRESIPVPDRWRLMDQLGLVNQRWYDPYNPNTMKGDRPVFGEDWFVNIGAMSDTLFEFRQVPTPIGAQSTQNRGRTTSSAAAGSRCSTRTSSSAFR